MAEEVSLEEQVVDEHGRERFFDASDRWREERKTFGLVYEV